MHQIKRPSPLVLAMRCSRSTSDCHAARLRHLTARKVPVALCNTALTVPSVPSPNITLFFPGMFKHSSKASSKAARVHICNWGRCFCNGLRGTIAPIAAAATFSDSDATAAAEDEGGTGCMLHVSGLVATCLFPSLVTSLTCSSIAAAGAPLRHPNDCPCCDGCWDTIGSTCFVSGLG